MIKNPDFNISCFPAFYVVSLPSNSKPPSQGGFFRHILKKKRSYPRKNSKYCNLKSPYSRKKIPYFRYFPIVFQPHIKPFHR